MKLCFRSAVLVLLGKTFLPFSLVPFQQCCVRVQVVKSESESESSPQTPSPRVRVPKFFSSPSHESSSPHYMLFVFMFWKINKCLFNICLSCLSSKTWKQTTKCIECQSKQRNTARPLLLGLGRDSGPSHEWGFLSPSPSQSEKNWTRVRVKWTRVRVPIRVTQHCFSVL